MEITKEQALAEAKKRGLVPGEAKAPSISREEVFKVAMERGLIKPREDGAGFLIRTKFSFADSDLGRKRVLEEEYGKGNSIKIGDNWLVKDKKGWNQLDGSSVLWDEIGDLADVVGELLEVTTATVG